jgi:hypothetical protein
MTIKQLGGVFGRNPTFNDVEVEGTLTVNGEPISDFGTMAQQDANSVDIDGGAIDGITLGTNSPVTNSEINTILIESDGNDLKFYRTDPTINANNGLGFIDFGGSDDGDFPRAAYIYGSSGDDNWGAGVTPTKIIFGTCSRFNSTPRDVAIMTQEGNLSLPIGNLVIGTSGQGIDFSATAGTGTSELLDDYEEGVWTPVFSDASSGGNTATGSASGYYIKVGGLVYVTGQFENVTTTGMTGGNLLYVQGIPYTPTSVGNDIFFMGSVKADGVTNSGFVNVESVDSYAWLRFAETNGATGGHLTVSDFASGTADIFFSLCYRSIL